MSLLTRLASPAGFALALLFFLFPFVAISCEAPGLGSIEVSYTGLDLATGADPSIETVGDFGREAGDPITENEEPPDPGVPALTIITLLLIVAGLTVTVAPFVRARLLGAVSAVVAGTMLVITEIVAQSNLESAVVTTLEREAGEDISMVNALKGDLIQTRLGFWLALLALLVALAVNSALLVLERRRRQ